MEQCGSGGEGGDRGKGVEERVVLLREDEIDEGKGMEDR